MSKITQQDYINNLELINDGHSQRSAAKILGIPRTTIQGYLKRIVEQEGSESIEVNSKKLEAINDMLKVTFANGIYTGTLNQNSSVDEQALLDAIVNTAKDSGNYECSEIDIEDLDDVNIEVTVPVKLTDLLKGDGYQLMTNIGAVNRDGWKFKPSVDKKLMKVKIKDDGCVSNIAEVVENDNLTIK